MTEKQFQKAREVMKTANWMRGEITSAKGEVAKWTNIEDSYRQDLKPTQADGAKKMLDKAMDKLKAIRQRFTDLKLPGEDFKPVAKWITAEDRDSFNYLPKEIDEKDFEKAKAEGCELFDTLGFCQKCCDELNSL